jgi:hypothetical protein
MIPVAPESGNPARAFSPPVIRVLFSGWTKKYWKAYIPADKVGGTPRGICAIGL